MNAVVPMMPDIDFMDAEMPDLYRLFADLRRDGHRVVPLRFHDDVAYAVLRFDDLEQLLNDEENLPAAPFYDLSQTPITGRVMLCLEGMEHHQNRSLVSKGFMPSSIRDRIGPVIRPLADELVDDLADRRRLDLVASFTQVFPFRVISRLLDVDPEIDAEIPRLLHLMHRFLWEPEDALAARTRFDDLLLPVIQERRRRPGDDLISEMIATRSRGEVLDDEGVLAFCRLLYPAGAQTTFLMMVSMMWRVLIDEGLRRTLVARAELRAAAVEEALRMYRPVAINLRYTIKDIEVAGVTIPKDHYVYIPHASANYDEAKFADPFAFRLDRFPDPMQPTHLSFGRGIHICLGVHLARAELRTGLTVLLDRLPGLRLADPAHPGPLGSIIRGVRSMEVEFDEVLPQASAGSAGFDPRRFGGSVVKRRS